MITHIVFFKLQQNNQANQEKLKHSLICLKNDIKVIQHIEIGINFADELRSYDLALIVKFDNKNDLNTYAKHPSHLKALANIKNLVQKTKVVDFES